MMEELFKEEPKLHPRSDSNSIDLKLYRDEIIDFFINKGLKTGDKVKNQVSVPNWIKKNKRWINTHKNEWILKIRPLVIACLKGLVDTDGSIYVDNYNKIICVGFKNASLPLVKDFKEMCESLGFRTGKITKSPYYSKKSKKTFIAYQTHIRAKSHVNSFLKIIKPMKW